MHEEDSGVPDGLVAPCGHRNPPSAHFCDVCGVKLPMQCPRCHAINRRQANFCSNCGIGLGDGRRAPATPSIVPFDPSPASSPATESESAPAPPEPFVPAKQAANEGMDGPASFDPLLRRRRRGARSWSWTSPRTPSVSSRWCDPSSDVDVATCVGAGDRAERRDRSSGRRSRPYSHRDAERRGRPFIDTDAQASIATRAEESASAAIGQSTPASTGPPDTTVSRITGGLASSCRAGEVAGRRSGPPSRRRRVDVRGTGRASFV